MYIYLETQQFEILVMHLPIFVADTKTIFVCNFKAPLKYNLDSLYFFYTWSSNLQTIKHELRVKLKVQFKCCWILVFF